MEQRVMTRHGAHSRTAFLVAVALVAATLMSPTADARPASVGIYRSDDPGSVNTYWIRAPRGLIIVDSGRELSSTRRALEVIRREGRPVVAILVTHAHPDHVGGLGILQDAFPGTPIYASRSARHWIETDPRGFFEITRNELGDDYPAHVRPPDHIVRRGQTLRLGGLTIRSAEFGPGEHVSQTLYYLPSSRTLFAGDVVYDEATPALIEGNSCGWLRDLARLRRRFPRADLLYPGHGNVGRSTRLIDAQQRYLQRFRRLVRRRISPESAGGPEITAGERRAVVAATERRYPGYLSVAGLTLLDLIEINVDSVAEELRSEPRRLPRPCQRHAPV
jgi:glyoxylase-like metal-dependent hydrolase (beta-lactamase superfamily II)